MNTPVTFPIAKLLKEKGFNEMCRQFWGYDSTEEENILIGENSPTFINNRRNDDIAAPTIAEVVMWLYEKHELWIVVMPKRKDKGLFFGGYIDTGKDEFMKSYGSNFNTPTEAYEAAIEYTLTKLI